MSSKDTAERKAAPTNSSELFPASVERALADVLPSKDPLDSGTFDHIEYINQHFPDEQSLTQLDTFATRLDLQIKHLDDEIFESIRNQAVASKQTAEDVSAAKSAIQKLYLKIKDIRGKAEQSEVMVEEICRDIKQLDNAKKHLTTTITALHKLQTWVTCIDQLKKMVAIRDFRTAAHLLGAVTDYATHFEKYMHVPKVKQLHGAVRQIRAELKEQIEDRFREIGTLNVVGRESNDTEEDARLSIERREKNREMLADAAKVVEAMGSEMRDRVIRHFCEDQMRSYERLYGPRGDHYSLAHVDRRYSWYRLLARVFGKECAEAFPASWHIAHRLAFLFCEKTRDHIVGLLDDDSDTMELVTALKQTLGFERSMVQTFEKSVERNRRGEGNTDSEEEEAELDEESGLILDPKSAESIRRKYERRRAARERAETETKSGSQKKDVPPLKIRSIKGLVSGIFQPYMVKYVELERSNLASTMDSLIKSSGEVQRNILMSALQMFGTIKKSMMRCKVISKSQAFFELQKEFKQCFTKYLEHLKLLLPKIQHSNSAGDYYSFSDDKERTKVCFLINTAAYCTETIPQVEEFIQEEIDEAFAEHIDMATQCESFFDVIALGVTILVSSVTIQLEPALKAMTNIQWGTLEAVGDQSEYIASLAQVLHKDIPCIRESLGTIYFSGFCDRFAAVFLPRYTANIFKCKKISEMAAQQLLLDTCAVKELILAVPQMGMTSDAPAAASAPDLQTKRRAASHAMFIKLVNQSISKTEVLIKLIGTPPSKLVPSFKMLWPKGTSTDLQRIMTLKGMSKRDQQDVLARDGMKYNATAPSIGSVAEDIRGNVKNTAEAFASMFNFRALN